MSRRLNDEDQEFGSDSFLDIIANIVGILIILIVVAGVKVAQQSTLVAEREDASAASTEPLEFAEPPESAATAAVEPVSESEVSADVPETSDRADARVDSLAVSELEDEIASLELHLQQLRSDSVASEQELQELLDELSEATKIRQRNDAEQLRQQQVQQTVVKSVFALRSSLASVQTRSATFQTTLSSLAERQSSVSDSLHKVAFETRQLQETLEQLEAAKPTGDRIHHRLSPVGQTVTDHELHFRIAAGRIAHIPLEPLLDLLKSQVLARRDVVMRFHRYEGMVGPVGGFRMQYTVRRDSVAPLQALQYGNSAYRMTVAKWTIVPADTLVAEPVGDALRIGSRFRQILEATDPDAAVTVWLYPEDFDKFAQIRELAHNLNLRVAARPLPEGTPIAGSPTGSRSTSQ